VARAYIRFRGRNGTSVPPGPLANDDEASSCATHRLVEVVEVGPGVTLLAPSGTSLFVSSTNSYGGSATIVKGSCGKRI
jgi:hypothetical protein